MPKIKENSALLLDTLEINSDFSFQKKRETQYHKAYRKHRTLSKLVKIIDVVSDKKKRTSYWKTYHCQNVILQDGNNFNSSLCRKRWCTTCCRIKTAELTNAYKEPILNLGDLHFVTLTRPNVKGRELKSEVNKLKKSFSLIVDNLRKNYKIRINGLRKLEITYNETTDTYHPHFHMIISDVNHAYALKELWLKQFPTANHKGQDTRPICTKDDQSFIELFKYATKEITKSGNEYSGEVLHTIYESLSHGKIYQKYGTFKKLPKEPSEAKHENSKFEWIESNDEIWIYDNSVIDYVNSSGETLISYKPTNKKITKFESKWHEQKIPTEQTSNQHVSNYV